MAGKTPSSYCYRRRTAAAPSRALYLSQKFNLELFLPGTIAAARIGWHDRDITGCEWVGIWLAGWLNGSFGLLGSSLNQRIMSAFEAVGSGGAALSYFNRGWRQAFSGARAQTVNAKRVVCVTVMMRVHGRHSEQHGLLPSTNLKHNQPPPPPTNVT